MIDGGLNRLLEKKCVINNIVYSNSNLTLKTNFNFSSGTQIEWYTHFLSSKKPEVLNNYYMKTFVFAKVTKGTNTRYFIPDNIEGYYTYNKNSYNQTSGSTTENQLSPFFSDAYNNLNQLGRVPYVLLTPYEETFSFDNIKTRLTQRCEYDFNYCGDYNIEFYAIPIDGKCDFNGDGKVLTDEFTPKNTSSSLIISPSSFSEIANIQVDTTFNTLTYDDVYTVNKVEFDYLNNKTYYIDLNQNRELITLPTTQLDKQIIVYKDGVNIRNDTIRPEYIALNAHQIRVTENKYELADFVDKSYTLMKKLNITKELNTSSPGKTRVKIKVEVPEGDRKNITIYQTIPKTQAASIDQITTINNATAQFFVVDKDPIIGWYFNESSGSEEIEYELPGSSEGGVIIIMQEAILFNQGSLIINYREGNCESDEAHLFDFDDLSASQVHMPNDGLYKVCVAHITENLYNTHQVNTLNISSHQSNLMNLSSTLSNLVQISTTNSNLYWNMRIQETNPSTKHSCIGSLNDTNNPSLFGDCGYRKENRIWVYLGEDIEPPETSIYYPYLAHTMKISLIANDELSGVDKSYYCIKNETNPCTNQPTDFTEYQGEFIITCPNKWGCIKEIFVYSTDIQGNIEIPKRNILSILDEGSSCQSDCTAKPSPNRYLSSCRNLNGCEYYNYDNLDLFDEGKYVADQCNYLIEDSWTYFNSTHEIKCPNGPFRKSRFTFEKLFLSTYNCDELIVIDYPVLLEGEQVKMKFIYCKDFN